MTNNHTTETEVDASAAAAADQTVEIIPSNANANKHNLDLGNKDDKGNSNTFLRFCISKTGLLSLLLVMLVILLVDFLLGQPADTDSIMMTAGQLLSKASKGPKSKSKSSKTSAEPSSQPSSEPSSLPSAEPSSQPSSEPSSMPGGGGCDGGWLVNTDYWWCSEGVRFGLTKCPTEAAEGDKIGTVDPPADIVFVSFNTFPTSFDAITFGFNVTFTINDDGTVTADGAVFDTTACA